MTIALSIWVGTYKILGKFPVIILFLGAKIV